MSIDRQSTATKRELVLSVLFPYKCNFHSHMNAVHPRGVDTI